MDVKSAREWSCDTVNRLRAEVKTVAHFPFQAAHINLENDADPSAVLQKDEKSLTILSDPHSYAQENRVFPINQDENTVFASYVYRDSLAHKYEKTLDVCTGSGVLAVAAAFAGDKHVVASDINPRCRAFVEHNNQLNGTDVEFVEASLFDGIGGRFDKITIDPPFMPAPKGIYPTHARGGEWGTDIAEPFFKQCWSYVKEGGCVQAILYSFADEKRDTMLDLIKAHLPSGWSYAIRHVFPVKELPIELYTTAFSHHKGHEDWLKKVEQSGYTHFRFYMITLRNDGKEGMVEESVSEPRMYNIVYPPTTLKHLSRHLSSRLIKQPISEKEHPEIGHLIRLARYNYPVYRTLCSVLD